jgi:hypothetical protein
MFAQRPVAESRPRASLPSRIPIKDVLYTFPSNLSSEDTLLAAFGMALTGSSTSAGSTQWKSYVLSYACLMTDGLARKVPSTSVTIKEITAEQLAPSLQTLRNLKATCERIDETPSTTNGIGLVNFQFTPGLPGLTNPPVDTWVGLEVTPKHVYSHWALVTFLAGKLIHDGNREQIEDKRPNNLVTKYTLAEGSELLVDQYRLSRTAHKGINLAWAEMSAFKAACFKEYCTYSAADIDLGQDIIYTMVRLLKYSGMQHAEITYRLLMAHPWVREIPVLASSVAIFETGLHAASSIDPALQPYVKLMYGDRSDIFPRKDMEPLVACAVASEKEIHETLSDFYVSNKHPTIVEKFLEEREARNDLRTEKLRAAARRALEEDVSDTPVQDSESTDGGDASGVPLAAI